MQVEDMNDAEFEEMIACGGDICEKLDKLLEAEKLQDREKFVAVAMLAAKCCVDMPVITPAHFEQQIDAFVESVSQWEETQH